MAKKLKSATEKTVDTTDLIYKLRTTPFGMKTAHITGLDEITNALVDVSAKMQFAYSDYINKNGGASAIDSYDLLFKHALAAVPGKSIIDEDILQLVKGLQYWLPDQHIPYITVDFLPPDMSVPEVYCQAAIFIPSSVLRGIITRPTLLIEDHVINDGAVTGRQYRVVLFDLETGVHECIAPSKYWSDMNYFVELINGISKVLNATVFTKGRGLDITSTSPENDTSLLSFPAVQEVSAEPEGLAARFMSSGFASMGSQPFVGKAPEVPESANYNAGHPASEDGLQDASHRDERDRWGTLGDTKVLHGEHSPKYFDDALDFVPSLVASYLLKVEETIADLDNFVFRPKNGQFPTKLQLMNSIVHEARIRNAYKKMKVYKNVDLFTLNDFGAEKAEQFLELAMLTEFSRTSLVKLFHPEA